MKMLLNYSFIITVTALTLFKMIDGSGEKIQGKIQIRLYKNGVSSSYTETPLEQLVAFLKSSNTFDKSKPIVILFHGLNMKADNRIMKRVVDAFGKSGKSRLFNVMVLQMVELFKNDLPNKCDYSVIQNAELAGNRIGEHLIQAIDAQLTKPDMLHFVGYSLGAHTAGYAARTIKKDHQQVNYIAGLDPAGYGKCIKYQSELGTEHVARDDARTVHLFHTNTYDYGSDEREGTADFYFNNGIFQPGCYSEKEGCSHARAVYYFIEAILNEGAFVGRKCGNFASFANCLCDSNETGTVKFPPDYSLKGVYYFRTGESSPFGLGSKGAVCNLKVYWERFHGMVKPYISKYFK